MGKGHQIDAESDVFDNFFGDEDDMGDYNGVKAKQLPDKMIKKEKPSNNFQDQKANLFGLKPKPDQYQ